VQFADVLLAEPLDDAVGEPPPPHEASDAAANSSRSF
jgi:hypothetical protein